MKQAIIILALSTMLFLSGCTSSDSSGSCPCGVNCVDRIAELEWENEELQDRVEELEAEVEELRGFMWDIEAGLYSGY